MILSLSNEEKGKIMLPPSFKRSMNRRQFLSRVSRIGATITGFFCFFKPSQVAKNFILSPCQNDKGIRYVVDGLQSVDVFHNAPTVSVAMAAPPPAFAGAIQQSAPKKIIHIKKPAIIVPKRPSLTLYNIHTGEWLRKCDVPLKNFTPDVEKAIARIFRDHRNGAKHTIDPRLIRLLHRILSKLKTNRTIHLVSGYRSAETNAMLCKISDGVASNSYHTKGMAADIFMEGIANHKIQRAACGLKHGGVGRYSKFVHVDTGRVRYWGLNLV